MPSVFVQLLGAPGVRPEAEAPGASSLLTQPRRLGVLSYLILARPRGLHSRDSLVRLFWPDGDQPQGRQALRNALHGIRQALGDGILVNAGKDLIGVNPAGIACDVLELEDDLARGRIGGVVEALGRGLMEGFHVGGAPEFEHWLDGERERIRRTALDRVRKVGEDFRMRGDLQSALGAARVEHQIAPEADAPLRRLLESLDAVGERASAVEVYERHERLLRSEFGVRPSDAAAALASSIREQNGIRRMSVQSVDVLHTRGTYLFLRAAHGGEVDDLTRARAFFEQALRLDPKNAPSLAGLSNCFAAGAARDVWKPFHQVFARAIELSQQALDLDPSLGVPHVHFGVRAMYLDDDWELAAAEFTRAVELDPTYAEAHRFQGIVLAASGRWHEAIEAMRESVRLEPSIPIFRNTLADAHMAVGDFEAALGELREALEADARYRAARVRAIRCLERLHRHDEAIAERRFLGRDGSGDEFEALMRRRGKAGYRDGRIREVRRTIQEVEATLDTPPSERRAADLLNPPELRAALACAEIGDWDGARRWRDRVCRHRPGRRPWFDSRPELAEITPGRLDPGRRTR